MGGEVGRWDGRLARRCSFGALSCACSDRPKGEHRTAQGFSPGKMSPRKSRGRPTSLCYSQKVTPSKADRMESQKLANLVWYKNLRVQLGAKETGHEK